MPIPPKIAKEVLKPDMSIGKYQIMAQEFWNNMIQNEGIHVFAPLDNLDTFFKHGEDELSIFLDPQTTTNIHPEGNSKEWPGELRECVPIQSLLSKPMDECVALDFGCGAGRLTFPLSRRFHQVYGFDIAEKAIVLAEAFNEMYFADQNNISFVYGDLLEQALAPDSIDFIVSHTVLQHISYMDAMMDCFKQFSQVLKPEGIGRIHVRTALDHADNDSCFHGVSLDRSGYEGVCQTNDLRIIEFAGDGNKNSAFITFIKEQP